MGAFISKEVRPKHTKRDDTSDPLCPSGFTYIDESCPNNFPPAYDGCYAGLSGDPCTGNQFYESVPALTAAATSGEPFSSSVPYQTGHACLMLQIITAEAHEAGPQPVHPSKYTIYDALCEGRSSFNGCYDE